MLSILLQSVAVSALLLAGSLPRVPPLELAPAAQRERIRAMLPPRPEDAGFTRAPERLAPVITAKAALVEDLETGARLYQRHPSSRLAIASLTKLMAVLVVLDEAPDLDRTAVLAADAHAIEGTRDWLIPGQTYSIRDLLRAALIPSAADATLTLADAMGGTRDEFIRRMNEKARELGLTGVSFTNSVGLDAPENYGTAQDVAALFRELWKHPFVRESLAQETFTVSSRDGRTTVLSSTNALLGVRGFGILGGKTGTTDEAGQAFVTVGAVEGGRPLLVVVLGSSDRFRDTKTLLTWAPLAWKR